MWFWHYRPWPNLLYTLLSPGLVSDTIDLGLVLKYRESCLDFFKKDLSIFTRKTDPQTEDAEKKIFVGSPCKLPQQLKLSRSEARSQELPWGLPHGCRCPRLWPILHYPPRSDTGSWMESGTVGTRTKIDVGSWCMGISQLSHHAEPFFYYYYYDDDDE